MPEIKHFLIDAGNVYLLADHNITAQRLINEYHVTLSVKQINELLHGEEEELFAIGGFDWNYYERSIKGLGLECKILYAEFKEAHNSHIYGIDRGFMDVLRRTERHFGTKNIAVVTQTHEWQTERERELLRINGYKTMDERFKGRVFKSNGLGLSKKSRAFWAHVFKATGFDPAKTLLVDDSQANLDAALNYAPGLMVYKYIPKNSGLFLDYLLNQKTI